jgi:hypothetical protein
MSQSRYVLKPTCLRLEDKLLGPLFTWKQGLRGNAVPANSGQQVRDRQSHSHNHSTAQSSEEAWRRLSAIQRGRSQSRGCVPAETKPARVWLSGRLPQGAAHKFALFFLLAAAWLTSASHFSSLIGSVFTLSAWYLTGVHVVGLERLVSKSARRREGVMGPKTSPYESSDGGREPGKLKAQGSTYRVNLQSNGGACQQ